ncbi:MAG: DMT family transporter [Saprospiraceae bacterium]
MLGLKYTSPINASLLMTSVPIVVIIFSTYINKEKLSLAKIIGIILGFIGVMMIILNKAGINFNKSSFKGDLFIFLNSISYSYYLVKVKSLFVKYNPITITKWMFLFGIIILLPFSFHDIINVKWETFQTSTWVSFFYILIFTTFVAYLFNNLALQKLNSSVVSIYIYLQPIIATLIAVIFIKDRLDILKIIAGIMIFTGIYLVSYRKKM